MRRISDSCGVTLHKLDVNKILPSGDGAVIGHESGSLLNRLQHPHIELFIPAYIHKDHDPPIELQ